MTRSAPRSQRALVNQASRTFLFLNHVDNWLCAQDNLVNKRNRSLIPALRERGVLADSLSRTLNLLGIERRQQEALTLKSYVVQKEATNGNGNGQAVDS